MTDVDLAAEVERVRAAAIEDAVKLLAENPKIAVLVGALQGAQVAANLMEIGWPIEQVRIVADTYRNAIAQEIEDALHAQ